MTTHADVDTEAQHRSDVDARDACKAVIRSLGQNLILYAHARSVVTRGDVMPEI
jgi:hypothetical protein